jgi:hypothetical protein
MKPSSTQLKAGDEIVSLVDGLVLAQGTSGLVLNRFERITVDDTLIAENTDRLGTCWLQFVDNDDEQIARWGVLRIARVVPESEPIRAVLARLVADLNEAITQATGAERFGPNHADLRSLSRALEVARAWQTRQK